MEKFYSKSHEYVEFDGDIATIGISNHAQSKIGEVVFVELPQIGLFASAGDEIAVIESVKAASDVYAPISGEVLEVNNDLENAPQAINTNAEGEGWLFKLKFNDNIDKSELMDAETYNEFVQGQ